MILAAAALQDVCDSEGWRHCFFGGLAVQRWGEPRETVDVDRTLPTGFTDEKWRDGRVVRLRPDSEPAAQPDESSGDLT